MQSDATAMRLSAFDPIVGHARALQVLSDAVTRGVVPHALLLTGPEGSGKQRVASALAQGLLCTAGSFGCGTCAACRKVLHGHHPDVRVVHPAATGQRIISVDAIREEVIGFVGVRPFEAERKFVILDDAHRMNAAAQNALLKTLEEPPASTHLILLSPSTRRLLPTIVSRCRVIRFSPLSAEELAEVVAREREGDERLSGEEAEFLALLSGGSAGRALELLRHESVAGLRERLAALRSAMEQGEFATVAALGELASEKGAWEENLALVRVAMQARLYDAVAAGEATEGLLNALDDVRRAQRLVGRNVQAKLSADALSASLAR